MRQVFTWEVGATAVAAPAVGRQTALLGGGFALVPLLAATGLALPLPAQVYRLAEFVVERTVALTGALPAGDERGLAPASAPRVAARIVRAAATPAAVRPSRGRAHGRRIRVLSHVVAPTTHVARSTVPTKVAAQPTRSHAPEEPVVADSPASAPRSEGKVVQGAPAPAPAAPAAVANPPATTTPPQEPVAKDPHAPTSTPAPEPAAKPGTVSAGATVSADPAPTAPAETAVNTGASLSVSAGPVSVNAGVTLGTMR
jgi:hypothetical protein